MSGLVSKSLEMIGTNQHQIERIKNPHKRTSILKANPEEDNNSPQRIRNKGSNRSVESYRDKIEEILDLDPFHFETIVSSQKKLNSQQCTQEDLRCLKSKDSSHLYNSLIMRNMHIRNSILQYISLSSKFQKKKQKKVYSKNTKTQEAIQEPTVVQSKIKTMQGNQSFILKMPEEEQQSKFRRILSFQHIQKKQIIINSTREISPKMKQKKPVLESLESPKLEVQQKYSPWQNSPQHITPRQDTPKQISSTKFWQKIPSPRQQKFSLVYLREQYGSEALPQAKIYRDNKIHLRSEQLESINPINCTLNNPMMQAIKSYTVENSLNTMMQTFSSPKYQKPWAIKKDNLFQTDITKSSRNFFTYEHSQPQIVLPSKNQNKIGILTHNRMSSMQTINLINKKSKIQLAIQKEQNIQIQKMQLNQKLDKDFYYKLIGTLHKKNVASLG